MSSAYFVICAEDLGLLLTQVEGADIEQNGGTFVIAQHVTVPQIKLQDILAEQMKGLLVTGKAFVYTYTCFFWHVVRCCIVCIVCTA